MSLITSWAGSSIALFFHSFVKQNKENYDLKSLSMDKQTQNNINKDLILRERLAIERTAMANDRTLLSFIRTALYFSIAGMSVNSLLNISYGAEIELAFWMIAVFILVTGIIKYNKQKKSLKNSERHIGDYKLEWKDEG
ncbi:MAG: DUF202 domain-containing protein [Flavobacterium sp.]|nr:DUF202 domain-containing protein [Flavobacterium sp.]